MNIDDFETMYVAGLRDALSLAETVADGLSSMAGAIDDQELADALRAHVAETLTHARQVRDILGRHDVSFETENDTSVAALIGLARNSVATMPCGALRDMSLISVVQRIEHHEIAVFGTLAAYAKYLGRHDEKRILGAILEDERAADEDLTDIATRLAIPAPIGVQKLDGQTVVAAA